MNAVRSNNVSLKYKRFTSSGYKVIGFTKIEFVAKSQFLWRILARIHFVRKPNWFKSQISSGFLQTHGNP